MKTLLIIDPQIDFISGSLAVQGAEEAMEKLIVWIEEHKDAFDNIILTMDFHPYNHCSFTEQEGPWPAHCVQYSVGSAFYPNLLKVVHQQAKAGKSLEIIKKGQDKDLEEYSAFKTTIPKELLEAEQIYMAGIAGDYCVKESYEDLIKSIPADRIKKIEECIPYIHKQEE